MTEEIEVTIPVIRDTVVKVDLNDVILSLNALPVTQRLNYIAGLLNKVDFKSKDIQSLLPAQKSMIIEWANKLIKKAKQ